MEMLAIGTAVTVSCALPDFPSLVAVIVAVPGETPVIPPVWDTVAMALFEVDHITVRPVRVFACASRNVT
jgi:hypothetical protein